MPRTPASPSRLAVAVRVLGFAIASSLKLAFVAVSIAAPLLAMWIASSLAAYRDASAQWTIVAGLAAWPLVPIGWELLGRWRARRRTQPATLTTFDRFVLRSLVVGLAFNGVLLVGFPATVFAALSTRGDWMLDGRDAPWAERTREVLVRAASGLEWLHEATHTNQFTAEIDAGATQTESPVVPSQDDLASALAELGEHIPAARGTFVARTDGWPWQPTLHPAVLSIAPEHEQSIESVARYLVAAEPDPVQRVKAIHDYVAHRVAYDVVSYNAKQYPDQSATTVFATRLSVCAGYANLAAALGDAAGVEIVVVAGDARHPGRDPSGEGHAWNAARIGDRWVLFDATWDAGGVNEEGFHREYDAEFLMAPPEVFIASHFPEEERWQLLAKPLSRAEFLRQTTMRPAFHARSLVLGTPAGWHIDGDALRIDVENPLRLELGATVRDPSDRTVAPCEATVGGLTCLLPAAGRYTVPLWHERTYLGELAIDIPR